jgi:phosphoserine phosphatase
MTPPSSPSAMLVATLICAPGAQCLDDARVAQLAHSLDAHSATLAPNHAVDFFLPQGAEKATAEAAIRAALGALPVDVIIQPVEGRRKRLFLADMDSTMIGQECIDELADAVGLKPQVSAITERAMRGEIAFEPALRERVALLKGLSTDIVDALIASRITLTPGGTALVRTMRRNGAYTALVSGGFTLFTGPISRMIGFDEHRANRLVVADGAFAGLVEEPILGREAKRQTLEELRTRLALNPHETMAVGDGANDLAMLGEAGLGVAFRAKPVVAEAAHARLDHADLSALLYAQGYVEGEIVR